MALQEYINWKLALFNEAGGLDEDPIARRLMLRTDPALAKLVDSLTRKNGILAK
jgi:hypothetical protein